MGASANSPDPEGTSSQEAAAAAEAVADEAAADEARLAEIATELADGVEAALGPWVERCVIRRSTEWQGSCPPELAEAAREAGLDATASLAPEVRAVLATDPDEQRVNPLQIVRRATAWPTAVLRQAGVPGVVRDEEAQRQFPDDDYDLTPANFAELDPGLAEAGIAWGAAKAHVVLARRRREGRR